MSRNYNDFCLYCTGNKVRDIRECEDRDCPFYQFRRGGLEPEVDADGVPRQDREKDICKKIVNEVLTVGD